MSVTLGCIMTLTITYNSTPRHVLFPLRELTLFFAQVHADWVLSHCMQLYATSAPSRPGPLADTHTCSHQHRYAHMNIVMLKSYSLMVMCVRSVWDVYLEDKISEQLKWQGSGIFGSVPLELCHICSQIHWNIRHCVRGEAKKDLCCIHSKSYRVQFTTMLVLIVFPSLPCKNSALYLTPENQLKYFCCAEWEEIYFKHTMIVTTPML